MKFNVIGDLDTVRYTCVYFNSCSKYRYEEEIFYINIGISLFVLITFFLNFLFLKTDVKSEVILTKKKIVEKLKIEVDSHELEELNIESQSLFYSINMFFSFLQKHLKLNVIIIKSILLLTMHQDLSVINQMAIIFEILLFVFLLFNNKNLINFTFVFIISVFSSYSIIYNEVSSGFTIDNGLIFNFDYKLIDISYFSMILISYIFMIVYEKLQDRNLEYFENEDEFNKVLMDNYNKNLDEKLNESQILQETNRISDLYKTYEIIKLIRKNKL